MEQRKKSFAGGFQQTQGLARTASQMFFKQEKTVVPITKRKIFWIQVLFFMGYFAGALAIVVLFFKPNISNPVFATDYNTATAPPVDWGVDAQGNACPFGGCTKSPTTPPPTSPAPTTSSPTTGAPTPGTG